MKLLIVAGLLLLGITASHAQSMPNYGPNAPPNADSFGQPPTGTMPPGVPRYGYYRAYPYHRYAYHHRYWRHRHWY
jgi:hypothetical protein